MTRHLVEAFLLRRFGPRATAPVELRGGEWSRAYAFRLDRADYVIRFRALVDDFAKDRLAEAHATPDLPIPRVIEIDEAFGGFYAISERTFSDYLDELDERAMCAVLPSLFAALDAARCTGLSRWTGFGVWGPDGNAPHPTW